MPVERLTFTIGDLAETMCDAVVNPTNAAFLLGHAGVSGALLRAGGEALARACAGLGDRQQGPVRVTGAGRLPARYVIHVASPVWRGGASGEQEALAHLHERVLEAADRLDCRTIALPAIGCGAHSFPSDAAAAAAVPAIERVLVRLPGIEHVELVFGSRVLLLDYASHCSLEPPADPSGGLREELLHLLRAGRDDELEQRVRTVADEASLRGIHELARRLLDELDGESSRSISVSALYVQAAHQVLDETP
jgi:O-acetyl-ADP-ribose deacetylase